MNRKIWTRLVLIFSQRNLMLLNAILCLCYPVCYILLVLLPYGDIATTGSFFTKGVIVLNSIFLLTLILNINTISLIYRQLAAPRKKYVRIIYIITFTTSLVYVLLALFRCIYEPGFLLHFHHSIRHSFRTLGVGMSLICLVFGVGLSVLLREYYNQVKMKHMLGFVIPATIHFAFKIMVPFLFTITAWILFGGCQLLLYFCILNYKPYGAKTSSAMERNNLVTG